MKLAYSKRSVEGHKFVKTSKKDLEELNNSYVTTKEAYEIKEYLSARFGVKLSNIKIALLPLKTNKWKEEYWGYFDATKDTIILHRHSLMILLHEISHAIMWKRSRSAYWYRHNKKFCSFMDEAYIYFKEGIEDGILKRFNRFTTIGSRYSCGYYIIRCKSILSGKQEKPCYKPKIRRVRKNVTSD